MLAIAFIFFLSFFIFIVQKQFVSMLQLSLPTLACSFFLSFPSFVFLLSFYPIFLLLSYLREAAFVSMLHFSMPAFAFSFFLSFFLFFSSYYLYRTEAEFVSIVHLGMPTLASFFLSFLMIYYIYLCIFSK